MSVFAASVVEMVPTCPPHLSLTGLVRQVT
jgi:hypothetical protein